MKVGQEMFSAMQRSGYGVDGGHRQFAENDFKLRQCGQNHNVKLTSQQISLSEAAFRRQGGGFMAVYDYGNFGTCKETWTVQQI